MRTALLRNIALSTLMCMCIKVQTAQAAVKLGAYYGKWTSTETYAAGDVVTFNNNAYLSLIAANKSKNPAKALNAWQVLAAGSIGAQGLQGLQGIVGVKGDTGNIGPQGHQGETGAKGDTGLAGIGSVGAATGDMQWWNGNTWVSIPVGDNNTTLKNCSGVPTWVASSASCPFLIGDTGPAGGKVFFINDATGQHGLEAAPVDQSTDIKWGCSGVLVGGTGTAVDTGKANTAAVNAKCGTGTAAKLAASYTLNGYSDWYLPSKDELNLLYKQREIVGGFFHSEYSYLGSYYWSSSEESELGAWSLSFLDGSQNSTTKETAAARVRAVRIF